MIPVQNSPASTLVAPRVSWTRVDTGFWVAHRDGEYFGCVDEVAGGFVTRDAHGVPVGRYDTYVRATSSLRSTADPVNTARRRRAERTRLVAATILGTAALGLGLTAGALAPYL